jgi:DNA-binding MarR family transcriptional regulator
MKSKRAAAPLTTYQKARLQVIGYRAIQARVNEVLNQHGINTSQWIILGWLHEHSEGLRVTALAEVLDVETPLATALLQALQEINLTQVQTDPTDRRARIVRLTTKGQKLVPQLEHSLTTHLRIFDRAIRPEDMAAYFTALEQFMYVSKSES